MCFAQSPDFEVYTDEFINNSWVHSKYKNLNWAFFTRDV
jgi:hypothetical protein